jgi:hypothetical protein
MKASIWLTIFFVAWVLQMLVLFKMSNDIGNLQARIKPIEFAVNQSNRPHRIRATNPRRIRRN